jgi:prepilin-type N-terminal cleavage/methylation domain-containing protein
MDGISGNAFVSMQLRSPFHELHRLNRGFSLFELLIVLAVIISVTAMAVPGLMDRLQNGRIQDAAEGVREVLANTRRYAIDSGVDYHFRFEVNGQAVVAIPAEPSPTLANNFSADRSDTRIPLESLILDDEIFLRPLKGENPGGEQLESKAFATLAEAGDLANRTWSSPILFRFDGSAEDRTFRVMDEEGRAAEVSVRGLTGAVRVTPVFIMEDQ